MGISDWSSDVCSSELELVVQQGRARLLPAVAADQRVARGGEQIAVDIVDRRAQLRRLQAQENLLHQVIDIGIVGAAPEIAAQAGAIGRHPCGQIPVRLRSEEHTSELQSLMRISYAVFCVKKKKIQQNHTTSHTQGIMNRQQMIKQKYT